MGYPTETNGPHQMLFNAGVWTFRLVRADNGVVFEEYSIESDEITRLVATTPEQLRALFDQWHAARTEKLVDWMATFLAEKAAAAKAA